MNVLRRPSRWTLRTRLLVALVVITVVGLSAFGTLSLILLDRSQAQRVDDQLNLIAVELQSTKRPPPPAVPPAGEELPSEFRLMFFDDTGSPLLTLGAPIDTSTAPDLPDMDERSVLARGETPFTVSDTSTGTHWRVKTIVLPAGAEGETAAVAISLATAEATTAQLRTIELVAGFALLAAMSCVAALLVRVGLRPLTSIAQTADAIAAGDLGRRVPDTDPHTEIGRLATAFNVMVTRLAAATRRSELSEQRMRTFVADASHELRTPLTTIRGYAELYRRGTDQRPDEVRDMMERIEAAAIRMGGLVNDLILLAELDEKRPLARTVVDLGELAAQVVRDARSRAPHRTLSLHLPAQAVCVAADEDRLYQAVENLVGNALVHTPETATVRVVVGTVDPASIDRDRLAAETGAELADGVRYAFVEVTDTGPGMPAETAFHVFDRFYKASGSRSGGTGSGLGLAITAAMVDAHDARLQLSTAPGQGATFRILLRPVGHPAQ